MSVTLVLTLVISLGHLVNGSNQTFPEQAYSRTVNQLHFSTVTDNCPTSLSGTLKDRYHSITLELHGRWHASQIPKFSIAYDP